MTFNEYLARLRTEAKSCLTSRLTTLHINVAAIEAYLNGDYWQCGRAWTGTPIPDDIRAAKEVKDGVLRDFAPIPLVEEVVSRHVDGLVGREIVFSMTDDRDVVSQADLKRANDLLTRWWDDRGALALVMDFTSQLVATGEATVRIFVPRERLDDNGNPLLPVKDAEAAARMVFVDVLGPDVAGVLVHRRSMRSVGVAVLDVAESQETDGRIADVARMKTELQWAEGNDTIIAVDESRMAFDNDGQLLIFQGMRLGGPLITPAVMRLQNVINFLNSMLPRNAKYAGHRERTLLNVQQPKNADDTPKTVAVGAGTFNVFQSAFYEDENGVSKPLPASLIYGEPVDSDPIRADIAHMVESLLRACKQLHVVMSADATASGVSRIEARAEFLDSLLHTKPAVEAMVRWLIKCLLLVSCHLADESEFAAQCKQMRATADVRLPAGNLSPDEKQAVIALKEAGIISRETAMSMVGVEDVDAEVKRIETEVLAAQDAALSDGFGESGGVDVN